MAEAEACFREALERSRRVLGPDHPETIDRIFRLGVLLLERPDEAFPLWREALERRRRVRGETHPDTLSATLNFAQVLNDIGKRPAEAEALLAEAVAAHLRAFDGPHPNTALLLDRHAEYLRRMGRLDEAEAEARRAVNMHLEHLGGDSRNSEGWSLHESGTAVRRLSSILVERGRLDEATAVLRGMLSAHRRNVPERSVDLGWALRSYAYQFLEIRTLASAREAEPLCREFLSIWAEHRPEDWEVPAMRSAFGESILLGAELDPALTVAARVARLREAEKLLVSSFASFEGPAVAAEPPRPHTQDVSYFRQCALARLVHLYEVWDRAEPARGFDGKAAEWKARLSREPSRPEPR